MKKLKKLVLKKETISVLNDYSQSMIKGGYDGSWIYFDKFITGFMSFPEITICQNAYLQSDYTFCACTLSCNGSCNVTCEFTCNQNSCAYSCETCA
jgi:hypothetical protein